jgi:protein phosphatase 1 regulatory subunit 7
MRRKISNFTTTPRMQQRDDQNSLSTTTEENLLFDEEIVDLAHHPHQTMGVEYRLGSKIVDLDLTNCRLRKIENISHLVNVKYLRLRQNLLTMVENLPESTDLIHLDLYNNMLKNSSIEASLLNKYQKLQHLDISFNQLRHCVIGLDLPELEELYYVNNKIKQIDADAVDKLPSLQILELGSNRIREIENLEKLVTLKQLWLGTNKITEIKVCLYLCEYMQYSVLTSNIEFGFTSYSTNIEYTMQSSN